MIVMPNRSLPLKTNPLTSISQLLRCVAQSELITLGFCRFFGYASLSSSQHRQYP